MGLEAETEMDGELAGKDVAHFGASAAKRGVKGLVVVADAVVAQHDIDGLLGTQGEVTAKARLEVEAIGHSDLVGAETEVGAQVHGKERRNLGCGEIGLQATKDLDVVANIIAGAMVRVASSAVILVAGVIEPIEVLVARSCADKEVVVDAVAADEVHTEGELLVLVKADATGGLDSFLKALILGKRGECGKDQDARKNESTHRKRYKVKQYRLSASR